jgi:hypothetical protein
MPFLASGKKSYLNLSKSKRRQRRKILKIRVSVRKAQRLCLPEGVNL